MFTQKTQATDCSDLRSCTRREVISFVPSLAVQLLLSQFVQQPLVLIPVMGRGCPLVDKVYSAAHTVTLMALKNKKLTLTSLKKIFTSFTSIKDIKQTSKTK